MRLKLWLLTLLTSLPARLLEHLAVLVLPHLLSALLHHRTHGVPPLDQGAGTELFARPSKGTLLAHPYIPIGGAVRGTAVSIAGTPALGETV